MKSNKIFGLTAALFMMFVTTGLWAQELKFDGYLNSGVGVVVDDREGIDPYFKAFGVDSESNGFRFRLGGSFTNEAKNAGVKFRLQAQRRMDQSGYLSMPYLYGWVGFLQNRITLTGGLIDEGLWTSADFWWNDDTGEGLGLLLKVEPFKGLIIGVGGYVISQQGSGQNNWLSYQPINADGSPNGNPRLPNFGDLTPNLEDVKYTFNLAYTLPDAFRFNASFRTNNKAGWAAYRNQDDYGYGGREESMFVQAEFRLLAVKNLTTVVVGTVDNIQDFDNKGNIMISETLGYSVNNLSFGLNAVQFFYNRPEEYNPGLFFNPWVSYAFNKIVPRLDLVYFMGGRSKFGYTNPSNPTPENQWERRGFANVAKKTSADDDYSVLSARPSVKFNLDGRIFLEIGDMINYDMAVKNGAYGDSSDPNKNYLFSNVFYVDLKFSF